MSHDRDSQFTSVRGKQYQCKFGKNRKHGNDKVSPSQNCSKKYFKNSQGNGRYRRNGRTLRSTENNRNERILRSTDNSINERTLRPTENDRNERTLRPTENDRNERTLRPTENNRNERTLRPTENNRNENNNNSGYAKGNSFNKSCYERPSYNSQRYKYVRPNENYSSQRFRNVRPNENYSSQRCRNVRPNVNYNNQRCRNVRPNVNYNNQRFRPARSNDSQKTQDSLNMSFNEGDIICSTFRDTPKTCPKASQKTKAVNKSSNKKEKSSKQNSPISNNLSNSIFVDPLPSVVESNDICKDANYSNYIRKSNLEFPNLQPPAVPKNPVIKTLPSLKKRHFSQSSAPSRVSKSVRKRNASAVSFSSQVVLSHKKFKEDSTEEEFEIFENALNEDNKISSPPTSTSPQKMKVKSGSSLPQQVESIKEKDKINSLPEPKVECKKEIENIESNVCKNKDLERSQSQPSTPFSIPCGQIQKKDSDELDCSTQEDRISLANFFSQSNSTQLSLEFEEDVKSKELHCSQSDRNNSNSVFHDINKSVLQTFSQNSLSIVESVAPVINNYDHSLFSASPTKNKLQENKIIADSQTNMCDESEFIPSSQESDITPSVLPNIESLKNLSKNMSEKKSISAAFQDSADFSALENPSESCEESTTSKEERKNSNNSFQNLCTPHPLTSTQYGPRRKNLYTPQISPLVTYENDSLLSDSVVYLSGQPNSSFVKCNNEKQLENTIITCATLSTQPFENNQTDEPSSKKNFESIKVKMEQLFDLPDCNESNNTLVEVASKNNKNGNENSERTEVINVLTENHFDTGEEALVSAFENGIEKSKPLEDSGNSLDITSFDQSSDKDEEALTPGSEARNTKDKEKNVHNTNNKNIKCKNKKSDKDNSQNIVTHQNGKKKESENEDETKDKNLFQEREKLNKKLTAVQEGVCREYDSTVDNVLNILKNLFERQKENYLNENISTTFNIKIKNSEGQDVHIEKKSFHLPNFKKANHEEPQNIVEITVKSKSYIKYSSVNNNDNFIDYSNQTYSNDKVKVVKGKTISTKDKVTKSMKKKKIESIGSKSNETGSGKDKSKNSPKKSFILNKNWWENIIKDIPDCVFESSIKVNEDECNEDTNENFFNSDNDSDSKSNLYKEECESESGNLHQNTKIKRKKKISKSRRIINDDDDNGESNKETVGSDDKEKIYANSPPVIELKPLSENPRTTPKGNTIKRHNQQHLICLNELSRNDDPALSNLKKTLKKKLKRNVNSQKTLTPPFQFKKMKTKQGKKRTLLNNVNDNY
ncbi:UNVERIFIED_CONTAM: hypothetical protein RMT77_015567 [Armadillidium vulgare]